MVIIRETLNPSHFVINLPFNSARKAAMSLCNRWVMELRLSDTLRNSEERLLEDYEIKQLVTERLRELDQLGITCQIVNIHNSPD